jgi:hypothetical protein
MKLSYVYRAPVLNMKHSQPLRSHDAVGTTELCRLAQLTQTRGFKASLHGVHAAQWAPSNALRLTQNIPKQIHVSHVI